MADIGDIATRLREDAIREVGGVCAWTRLSNEQKTSLVREQAWLRVQSRAGSRRDQPVDVSDLCRAIRELYNLDNL